MASGGPAQLSGGQQQRVALARALVFEPKLVLMDEPLGALDKQLREQMQVEIKHLHERLGVTVVYVTHDQGEALTMSDRIAVFNDGVIQQLAPPHELYERPAQQFRRAVHRREQSPARPGPGDRTATLCRCRARRRAVTVRRRPPAPTAWRQPTMLSLRPERVQSIRRPGSVANRFCRVEELIYVGDHIRARVAICGSADFIVKVPNCEGAPPRTRGRGDRGVAAEDCRALDS